MHTTAMINGKLFFETYLGPGAIIVDVGAMDVNGSLRSVAPNDANYVGLDFSVGKGVDVVLNDPYVFPLSDDYADAVVSSSCFEHIEMFWLTVQESLRVLKPYGLLYVNAPSEGPWHRHPVDCWRFLPDSGSALVSWAQRCGFTNCVFLESFVTPQQFYEPWSDSVIVILKDRTYLDRYPTRILHSLKTFTNGKLSKYGEILNEKRHLGL